MDKPKKVIFISLLTIFFLLFFLFVILEIKDIVIYTIVFISSSVIFILLCREIFSINISDKEIITIVILTILLKLSLIFLHPIGSDDYYRYLWDGKVQANGINPYKYAPDDKALNFLHSSKLPKLVNYPNMKTIYPPLGENLFYAAYLISGESFWGLKILLFVFDLMTILGLYLILKKLKLPNKNILFYALCPLPIFQFMIDAHVDGFGLPLFVFAVYFYLNKKKYLSYFFLGMSICIKPLGLILVPIFFFIEKDFIERIKTILIPLIISFLFYLPYLFNGSPFQSMMTFTENWTFNGVVFDILDSFIHDNQITRIICGLLLLIVYFPIILSKKDIITKIYLSIFLLLIFSPIVHPWYVTWLVILLPIIPKWSGILFAALVSLTAFTILNYQLHNVWKDYTLVLIFEYFPVITVFMFELFKQSKNVFLSQP